MWPFRGLLLLLLSAVWPILLKSNTPQSNIRTTTSFSSRSFSVDICGIASCEICCTPPYHIVAVAAVQSFKWPEITTHQQWCDMFRCVEEWISHQINAPLSVRTEICHAGSIHCSSNRFPFCCFLFLLFVVIVYTSFTLVHHSSMFAMFRYIGVSAGYFLRSHLFIDSIYSDVNIQPQFHHDFIFYSFQLQFFFSFSFLLFVYFIQC